MSRMHLGLAVVLGVGALAVSCVETPGTERIIGPDGTHMLHVHCGDEQAACFQLAGDNCPSGYDLSPIFDPHDGNFLVRCRNPPLSGSVAIAPTPRAAGPSTQAPPASENVAWPPAEVALPSEPWPEPSSAGAPPAAPRNRVGAVGIGY